ncbi:hypothetical protein CONLIGDRAFT_680845 [Coniochaeta ligniaria NRRL 30616]|uniref:Uncharacterized protein n=1 Tax=Coniochaeta ligniaria NRRL 30616 TaxID=1408157 RepID=A0A1J7JQM8_9PEZI|nr:hypothetical protein CONLIGDRAFT_680845 [Coniochaeta ligniaria NRRL 30616]
MFSIEQWRRAVARHFERSVADTADSPGAPPNKRKQRDYDTALPAMSSPPASDRSQSPSRRIKLSHRDGYDDPFLAGAADARPDADSDQTPRRNTTADIISSAPPLPLKKPIHHVQIDDNKTDQLPKDIRDLYNRLYDITGYHEGIAPWEVRNEINASVAHKFRETWFRNRRGTTTRALDGSAADEHHRASALGELVALRKIQRKARSCRVGNITGMAFRTSAAKDNSFVIGVRSSDKWVVVVPSTPQVSEHNTYCDLPLILAERSERSFAP